MGNVAQIEYDCLEKRKGELKFSYEGFMRYWGAQNFGEYPELTEEALNNLPNTKFRLYDDDKELYFTGWLKNDDEALVQQFVLAWAMADSGCTTIMVQAQHGVGWEQVIG